VEGILTNSYINILDKPDMESSRSKDPPEPDELSGKLNKFK